MPDQFSTLNRTDVLIYCHDGRGLGHLSRSIAIGLAIRRLRPTTRVVLLTGSEYVPALTGYGRMDWIKLPSYRSPNGSDNCRRPIPETAAIRRQLIRNIVADLKPAVILVDHYPLGKQDELLAALEDESGAIPVWFLGLRAVVGRNPAIWSKKARRLVREKYTSILWYGDSSVGSGAEYDRINKHFEGLSPLEVGYVSRAEELSAINALPLVEALDGIAAFSWCSPASIKVLSSLASVIERPNLSLGSWRVTIGANLSGGSHKTVVQRLASNHDCEISCPDLSFLSYLKRARVALLHAGYNSLTDLIWAGVPSVVVIRQAKDAEQLLHSQGLSSRLGSMVLFLKEQEAFNQSILRDSIATQANRERTDTMLIGLRGAETAALAVLSVLCNHGSVCMT